jgi:hypothetical protein
VAAEPDGCRSNPHNQYDLCATETLNGKKWAYVMISASSAGKVL